MKMVKSMKQCKGLACIALQNVGCLSRHLHLRVRGVVGMKVCKGFVRHLLLRYPGLIFWNVPFPQSRDCW